MLKIRFAKPTDVDEIMNFIHNHWKKNHILSKDKDLFLFEYQENKTINFVLAEDNKKIIYAVLGFIKSSNKNNNIWVALWKSIKYHSNPMLGVELLEFLRESYRYNKLSCVGIADEVIPIYKYLGFYTNHLDQYIIINKHIKKFDILKIKDIKSIKDLTFMENAQYKLVKLVERELNFDFDDQDFIPHKDKNYFIKRYFKHPTYIYETYGIYKGKDLKSLIVTREVKYKDSKVLRIVDYLGDEKPIVYITNKIYQIVVNMGYEYVDFLCYGLDHQNLKRAGFSQINLKSSEIIAPNYFSPFIQKNIKVNFMVDTKETNKLRICKADGDQDRPN